MGKTCAKHDIKLVFYEDNLNMVLFGIYKFQGNITIAYHSIVRY
jgi:hypothetical protein